MVMSQSTISYFANGQEITLLKKDEGGRSKVICDLCGSAIGITGNQDVANYLGLHRGTDSCTRQQQAKRQREEMLRATAVLETLKAPLSRKPSSIRLLGTSDISSASTPYQSTPGTPTSLSRKPTGLYIDTTSHVTEVQDFDLDLADSFSKMQTSSPETGSPAERSWEREPEVEDSCMSVDVDFKSRTPVRPQCHGVLVAWKAGSVWDSYPYHVHAHRNLSWYPVSFEPERQMMRLKSTRCSKQITTRETSACIPCSQIPNTKEYQDFQTRAIEAPEHLAWIYLSQRQLYKVIKVQNQKLRYLRVKCSNQAKRIARLSSRINDYQQMTMFIATHNIPGLRHLISGYIRRHRSPKDIVTQLEKAAGLVYCPDGGRWTERDFDLAELALVLGGNRLLEALSTSQGYPSKRTLRACRKSIRIAASVGEPSREEFDANISSILGPEGKGASRLGERGLQQVMIDDIALEEQITVDIVRNILLGLCREHSSTVGTVLTTPQVVDRIEEFLSSDKVHRGKEATVLAIASVGNIQHYSAIPLALSATCKQEKGFALAKWLRVFLDCYKQHQDGEKTHGRITSLASDGASTFRSARFTLFMSQHIDPKTPLGLKLRFMPGLNLFTGPDNVLGTCDPKHVIKRFATLVRSSTGIQVGATQIFPADFLHFLSMLPNLSKDQARHLMDPADKQNVPKAVKLMQALHNLKDLPNRIIADLNPSERHRLSMVSFIAEIFNLFVEPFVNVTLDIDEQVELLCTYAHICAAMYRRHKSSFFGGALYADSQAIIKNIVFTVAHLQLISFELPYFIPHEGSDRLENLFSAVRTHDHSPNVSLGALQDKIRLATDLQFIYERQPDIYNGHRRRNLVNAKGVDHTNPASWVGELRVGRVDLNLQWRSGRLQSLRLLRTYIDQRVKEDSEFSFLQQVNCDFLRPYGDYVGTSIDPGDIRLEDDLEMIEDVPSEEMSPEQFSRSLSDNEQRDGALPTQELEELLEVENEAAEEISGGISKFFTIGDKQIYKSTYVMAKLGSANGKKSIMRTLRAQGKTAEDCIREYRRHDLWAEATFSETPDNIVRAGEPVATLVRAGKHVCLVVIDILGFEAANGGPRSRTREIRQEELEDAEDCLTYVVGQIMDMTFLSTTSLPCEAIANTNPNASRWIWERTYVQFGADQTLLRVPGPMIWRLKPAVESVSVYIGSKNSTSVSWSFTSEQLESTLENIWDGLEPSSDEIYGRISALPLIEKTSKVPYIIKSPEKPDEPSLLVRNLPQGYNTKKRDKDEKVLCKLCKKKSLKLREMREHVGRHILFELRGVADTLDTNIEIGPEACGWCGLDDCMTKLRKDGDSVKIISNCDYHYEGMQYKAAQKGSSSSPCTNVPLFCLMCPPSKTGEYPTIWKYNALYHLVIEHSSIPNPDPNILVSHLPVIPGEFIVDIFIESGEEARLGVPGQYTETFREAWSNHSLPATEDVNKIKAEKRKKKAGEDETRGRRTRRKGGTTTV